MATLPAKLTIEDYENLPDELAINHELVDGELVDVSGNLPKHLRARDELLTLMRLFAKERKLGIVTSEMEYDFQGNAHGPDVSFYNPSKRLLERERRVQRFVPDFAIEIASKNDRFVDLLAKIIRYRRCGTREVWLLSMEERLAFFFSEEGNRILTENDHFRSQFLPGFSIPLTDIFDV
jgi:Uma2 family endonuclease